MVRRSDEGEAQSRFERDRWTFYEAIIIGNLASPKLAVNSSKIMVQGKKDAGRESYGSRRNGFTSRRYLAAVAGPRSAVEEGGFQF